MGTCTMAHSLAQICSLQAEVPPLTEFFLIVEWAQIVGKVSPWLELDSHVLSERRNSEEVKKTIGSSPYSHG
jgi:hypothetical protein